MMITMHSVLRDRYLRLSSIFENSLLVASVVLNSLVFIDSKLIFNKTHIDEGSQKIIIGISSILVFAISVILIQVKWKEKADGHSKAAEQLSIFLQECRNLMAMNDGNDKDIAVNEFDKRYMQVSGMLCKIPDNKFTALKLRHYRKVEMSKLASKNPGSPYIILKTRLFLTSFKKQN